MIEKRSKILQSDEIKEIPYGVSDFTVMRDENLYYVDKSMYIPTLENEGRFLFFIRPRRFGKSLFISMLKSYYDCNTTPEQFNRWFGDLWIGQHPTRWQGKYQILHLDFSSVGGKIEDVEVEFDRYCRVKFDSFVDIYRDHYSPEFIQKVYDAPNANTKLILINDESQKLGLQNYLIIDEYDNFTNTILNEKGEDVYHAITHADGFYRDVFKKFKGTFTRIFMTGVSPVTLDDVTSGFNIGWHISTKKAFNQMLGFSQEDVRKMFTYFKSMGKLPADCDIEWMINDMKPWYDNYCFAEGALNTQSKVFNCDMVVYYLRNYINEGKAPKEMIDRNTRTDYSKMKKLIQLDKLDGNRKSIIKTIAETGEIVAHLEESFSAYQLTDPNIFPSLLFYYGMLTIKGTRGDRMVLGIPNNNVRKQYYDYLKEMFEEKSPIDTSKLDDCFYDMAYEGKWQEGLTFLAESYAKVSSVRDGIEGERNIQGFFMAYLNLCNYYITAPELELNHGFCDFFLLPNLAHYAVKHSYIIELKVLPKKDFSALCEDRKTTKAEAQWNEAVAQIHRYAEAPRVKALRQDTILHKIVMQFEGWELKKIEEVE